MSGSESSRDHWNVVTRTLFTRHKNFKYSKEFCWHFYALCLRSRRRIHRDKKRFLSRYVVALQSESSRTLNVFPLELQFSVRPHVITFTVTDTVLLRLLENSSNLLGKTHVPVTAGRTCDRHLFPFFLRVLSVIRPFFECWWQLHYHLNRPKVALFQN